MLDASAKVKDGIKAHTRQEHKCVVVANILNEYQFVIRLLRVRTLHLPRVRVSIEHSIGMVGLHVPKVVLCTLPAEAALDHGTAAAVQTMRVTTLHSERVLIARIVVAGQIPHIFCHVLRDEFPGI